jgi:hypothetical protein
VTLSLFLLLAQSLSLLTGDTTINFESVNDPLNYVSPLARRRRLC